jgi:hypothetical protein
MSDGMSDANAEGELASNVWRAAFDLREAIWALGKAIQRARMGHRGWNIPRGFIVREVNDLLRETDFGLTDKRPDKCFEHYGAGAYKPRESWRELELRREVEGLRSELEAKDKEIRNLHALFDGAYI